MSYIRCLTNSEGLYVWGGADGTHFDLPGDDIFRTIPDNLWEEFLDWYLKKREDNLYFGNASHWKTDGHEILVGLDNTTDFKVRMAYLNTQTAETWELTMYEVTWDYIINGVRDSRRRQVWWRQLSWKIRWYLWGRWKK